MESLFQVFGMALKGISFLFCLFIILVVASALLNVLVWGVLAHWLGL
jgi:hypothetical protein